MTILESLGNGCAFLDFNNDGNIDILLVAPKLALYAGDGHGQFTDVTRQMHLDTVHGNFCGCAVGDYDNDGYEDIYLTAYRGGVLLHNEGGKAFKDVTKESGIAPQPWGTSAAWFDVDNDGKLDLFIGDYVEFGPKSQQLCNMGTVMSGCPPAQYPPLPGVLYRNLGGGRFEDATKQWIPGKLNGQELAVVPADFDGSGRQSLFLGDDHKPANLLKNDGHQLRDITKSSGTVGNADGKPLGEMGSDWGDYDNDGRLDLAVAPFIDESLTVYHNEGNDVFQDESASLGLGEDSLLYVKFGEKWLDLDNSGWLDLIVSNGHIADNAHAFDYRTTFREPTLLFRNAQGVQFLNAGQGLIGPAARPIVGRGLAIGDFDNDGRIDVLIVDSEGTPLLLHNETPDCGHWLEFQLIGTKSNRDGQGALVTVQTGSRKLLRLCTTAGSYLSASDKRVHVGLANATAADEVTVRWPSGHVDMWRDLQANHQYALREGGEERVMTR